MENAARVKIRTQITCCLNCKERHINCHSECKKYLTQKQELNAYTQCKREQKEKEFNSYKKQIPCKKNAIKEI